MCGIAGIVNFDNSPISQKLLIKMRDSMYHRGPDSAGFYISNDKKVGIAARRLAILDLSEKGNQPMTTDDKTLWIVHNGEIYNFIELRQLLQSKGYKFNTNTDTEVILYLYKEYGIEAVNYLRGMFSFAIFDEKSNEIFIARDRLGIKPVYYYIDDKQFVFASEIKAMINTSFVTKEIDTKGILSYLYFGSVPYPYTIIKNIKILEPGNFIKLNIKDRKFKIKNYWEIQPKDKIKKGASDKFIYLLKEAIKLHLISDVPIGVFLSGGIDSTAILSLIKEVANNEIKTISIKFNEKEYDESFFIQKVVEKYKTQHNERIITADDVKKEFDKIINAMDQPTVDGVNTYFITKFAKELGVKVGISGLGGDELFGGYPSFNYIPKMIKLKKLPFIYYFIKDKQKAEKIKFFINYKTNQSIPLAYFIIRSIFIPHDIQELLKIVETEFNPIDYIKNLNNTCANIIDAISFYELKMYMANQLLRDTDVMSMANSIEVRTPLIDHKIVEFAFSLPDKCRQAKKFFINCMKENLPIEIYNRKKQAFIFPFAIWIRNELKDLVKESLFDTKDDMFDNKKIHNLWHDFINNKIHWQKIWSIAILKRWLLTFKIKN